MNKKLIIALVLVLAMVFSFVACKDTTDESKEPTDAENTTAEITTDEDGFMDIGTEDNTASGDVSGNQQQNNGGNSLVISPGDDEGAGFEDAGGNGNSGNNGGDIILGDGNEEDSIDWDELG